MTLAGDDRRLAWERALITEASMYRDVVQEADTIYLGGGTPSALEPDQLRRVVRGVQRAIAPAENAVLFLEVNPEDVDPRRAREWAELGVDFVSVGIQSLNDKALEYLGRRHDRIQGLRAVSLLLDAGIPTVSIDLIFGIPGQTSSDWRGQLEAAARTGASHLSCYQLTIHDGTAFGKRRRAGNLVEMADSEQADLYLLTHDILGDFGFDGYEVSNFARPGHRSKHNLKYWTGAPYLGIGPAAHSFDGHRCRWWNTRKVRLWQNQIDIGCRPVEDSEILEPVQSALEAVMLGVRMAEGIDLGVVEDRWGVEVGESSWRILERMAEEGFVLLHRRRVRPTAMGMAVADSLARSVEFTR